MPAIHLVHGILERAGRLLLVASQYPNHALPLWNIPGGRRREDEFLEATLRREFVEECGLFVEVRGLRYVVESFDPATGSHFIAFVFTVASSGRLRRVDDAHVVDAQWVALDDLRDRLTVGVVREPLLAHLVDPGRRYFAYPDAGVSIVFADEP